MQSKIFGMPLRTAPRWQFWLARIFGKTIVFANCNPKQDCVFKQWRGCLWLVKVGGTDGKKD